MNKYIKKLSIFFVALTIVTSLSACSMFSKSGKNDNNTTKVSENKKQDGPKIAQDTKKTEELKKEKEIYNGQVYVQNNVAIATMLIKDGVSEQEAKALAEKYAKQLKVQYNNMKVNVQAVQNGKNIANITIE
ncbi:hypothetical protein [Clostridium sp. DJ247]|uniref:hypothetical protein n=1 Tax=Clostridium sp. DJ247 TaxID=2726188 RepID=UPI0016280CF7|nr:hypothetical protein [Clostridium sp. DJ247]MBC2580179.1 hypothetical protein [Clostridium sp. DJ247]